MTPSQNQSSLSKLAARARELETLTSVCKKCGICQSVCPLFPHTGLERDIARGKIAVLEGVMTDVVKNADAVMKRLDRCLLCGACADVCPNGVDTMAIFIRARALLTEYRGLSPVKKLIFRQLLARPDLFDGVIKMAAGIQHLFIKKGETDTVRPRAVTSPMISGRHIIPLADMPFHSRQKPRDNHTPKTRGPILFFTGCLIDKFFPSVAEASVAAMEHHGFTPVVPKGQGCCGIPALSSGDMIGFTKLVRYHMALFSTRSFDRVVTACATCAFTIKKIWPSMIAPTDPLAASIRELAEKTTDITDLIAGVMDEQQQPATLPDAIPVTYHDPCHLKKSLGIHTEPRRLIETAPEYKLVEMEEADKCCGMGGGFGIKYADLSRALGMEKQTHIADTGCRIAATTCPACMIQIADMLSETGRADIAVRHPIELYMKDK